MTKEEEKIKWTTSPGYSWSLNCDFMSGDITNGSLLTDNAKLCLFKCLLAVQCTHYSWLNRACYLKRNTEVSKNDAFINENVHCGIRKLGNYFS
jgi:hypothetical protein